MVTSGPVPIELRESAAGWAECVTGALPEQEYLDLIAQAGFENVTTRRSASMGEAFGISVYSVIASAQKPSPVWQPRDKPGSRFQKGAAAIG